MFASLRARQSPDYKDSRVPTQSSKLERAEKIPCTAPAQPRRAGRSAGLRAGWHVIFSLAHRETSPWRKRTVL